MQWSAMPWACAHQNMCQLGCLLSQPTHTLSPNRAVPPCERSVRMGNPHTMHHTTPHHPSHSSTTNTDSGLFLPATSNQHTTQGHARDAVASKWPLAFSQSETQRQHTQSCTAHSLPSRTVVRLPAVAAWLVNMACPAWLCPLVSRSRRAFPWLPPPLHKHSSSAVHFLPTHSIRYPAKVGPGVQRMIEVKQSMMRPLQAAGSSLHGPQLPGNSRGGDGCWLCVASQLFPKFRASQASDQREW